MAALRLRVSQTRRHRPYSALYSAFDSVFMFLTVNSQLKGLLVVLALVLGACVGPTTTYRPDARDELVRQSESIAAYTRSRFALHGGDLEVAVYEALRAVELAPAEPDLLLNAAEVLGESQELQRLSEVLATGLPNLQTALVAGRVGMRLMGLGLTESAISWAALSTRANSWIIQAASGEHRAQRSALVYQSLAEVQVERNLLDQGEQTFRIAVSMVPRYLPVLHAYSEFLREHRDPSDAHALVAGYLSERPGDAEGWRYRSFLEAEAGDPGAALASMERAFDLEGEERDLVHLVVLAYEAEAFDRETELAETCFRLFRQNVHCRVAHVRALELRTDLTEDERAEMRFDTLQHLGRAVGANISALRNISWTLRRELGEEANLVFLRSILTNRQFNAQIQMMAAWAAYRLGDEEAAVEHMFMVLRVRPHSPDVLNFIGYSYAERGILLDQAEGMIIRALEIRPNDGNIQDSLGWVYYMTGRFEEAVQWLEQANETLPEHVVLLDHLADAYRAVGRLSAALDTYRAALAAAEVDDDELVQAIQAKIQELEAQVGPSDADRSHSDQVSGFRFQVSGADVDQPDTRHLTPET